MQGINTDMEAGKQGICTMQGMKMGKQWNELPAGIYIVDGVKCIKKSSTIPHDKRIIFNQISIPADDVIIQIGPLGFIFCKIL